MKKFLLTLWIAIVSIVASAQTDMTKYLVNPGFENSSEGWTLTNMSLQDNNSFSLKVGKVYVEKWTRKELWLYNGSAFQTVSGLPNGNYTISAVAQNINEEFPREERSGASLVANGDMTPVTLPHSYSVSTNVTNGSITFGFQLIESQANYACVDDFKLTYNGCTVAQLSAMITEAEQYAELYSEKSVKAAHIAAIANAKAQTTEEGISDVAIQLFERTNDMKQSAEAYSSLKAAIDDANTYWATSPAIGADELKSAIDVAQAVYDAATADSEAVAAATKTLETVTLRCRLANATGSVPKVTSEPFMPTGSKAILGRMTATGISIKEKGFVWATHPNPTIEDNRTTVKYSHNGDIYELSPLEPATEYYVRAYALTTGYAVGYGEEQRIFTKPQANVTWYYDNAGDAATNERINNAVKEAVDLYNIWSSITGFNLAVHYVPGAGAGDGTADCSYGGWMRISQNTAYQRTGTVLHEASHGDGIIPFNTTRWTDSNLRVNGDRGNWLGWRATQMIRFLTNDKNGVLQGDNQHLWPYGINGANEDNGQTITYIANILVVHACHEDGVQPVSGQGASAAYTFAFEDGRSYFITNENADYNKGGQAYLYETSTGTLKWGDASSDDIKDDSSFAWQFEYVPEKAYYRIRNAKSGHYFTYSGSTIKAASKTTPGTTECFQLMVGNYETTIGYDKTVTKRAYSIQQGTGIYAPYVLSAGTNGLTSGAEFSTAKSATKQRWIILTAEEAKPLAGATAEEHIAHLRELIDGAKQMLAKPHNDKEEGASDAMQSLITEMEGKVETISGISEAKEAVATMYSGICQFISTAFPTEIGQPYDLTCLITEKDFATTDTWSFNELDAPTFAEGVGKSCGVKFKFSHTLKEMPIGIYQLNVQACQRPTVSSYIGNSIINKVDVALMDENAPVDNPALLFADGAYDNHVVFKLTAVGDLPIMVANNKSKFDEGDITLFTNFRLYYFGNDFTKPEVTSIENVNSETKDSSVIYDLMGRPVLEPTNGIYIKNGKKFVVKK